MPDEVKKTKKELLMDEAKALGLEFQDNVTIKQLKALIKTEELKAELPPPPPPPPSLKKKTLPNKDVIISVGPGGGARLLQGQVTRDGEDKWIDLILVTPPGAPKIRIKAARKVKEIRLLQSGHKGAVLDSMKL